MEPANKRRKLAPKVPEAAHGQSIPPPPPAPAQFHGQEQQQTQQPQQAQQYPASEGTGPVPQQRDHDFEAFARHLQDAAMYIYRQIQKSPYAGASVLLLRWEEDTAMEADVAALEAVFRDHYRCNTDRWNIPTTANPSIKLGVQMASFLDHARPDHLLIIFYAGHGFIGADNQLYWACNSRPDACKLKWDGVRCLFEDAQSDILLLLDSCAVRDSPLAGSHGVKQAIAAYSPEQSSREALQSSFTMSLCSSLMKLSVGRPFSVQRLYDEILSARQSEWSHSRLPNGGHEAPPSAARMPICFNLTPGRTQNINLAPLPSSSAQSQSTQAGATDVNGQNERPNSEDQVISPGAALDLIFDEPRVLVCTTFVGEASPDMQYFNQWLHTPSAVVSKVVVEGMFLGPPTMLIISMPSSIWSVVEYDKVCCYLGTIQSHNLTHLYQRLLGSSAVTSATRKEVEDGRILLEAREAAAAGSPASLRREPLHSQPPGVAASNGDRLGPPGPVTVKEDVEETAEMKEAAEQLKALSHVRHVSDASSAAAASIARQSVQMADSIDVRHANAQSPPQPRGPDDLSTNEGAAVMAAAAIGFNRPPHTIMSNDYVPAPMPDKPRKSLIKQAPKQETRCTLCSHAPFKDTSSLRKHIAAAHTRPFPCAFSFAGCTSTFGSKNEWKRHIASQHLCLTYFRCSACPQSAGDGRGNEFNRKDLFTQHLRRMHAPFAIKKSLGTLKADQKMMADWEAHVKEMQTSCLVTRRAPPPRSACPKAECQSVFEGAGSWEEWTEHVGRHMEKGEGLQLGVDRLLAKWALEEGIIEPLGDGRYRLTSTAGMGSGNGGGGGGDGGGGDGNGSFVSDGGGGSPDEDERHLRVGEDDNDDDDDAPSITVATTAF